jgi:hypothetical protein
MQVKTVCRTLAGNRCDMIVITDKNSLMKPLDDSHVTDHMTPGQDTGGLLTSIEQDYRSYTLKDILNSKNILPNPHLINIAQPPASSNDGAAEGGANGGNEDKDFDDSLAEGSLSSFANSLGGTAIPPPTGGSRLSNSISVNQHQSNANDDFEAFMRNKMETIDDDTFYLLQQQHHGGGGHGGAADYYDKSIPKYLQKLQYHLTLELENDRKKRLEKSRKLAIVILARFHGYETNSNWICEGILKFLL